MTIWKYKLEEPFDPSVEMPSGARILHVASQTGQDVTLWVLVDTETELEVRNFVLCGTGHRIQYDMDQLAYMGTANLHSVCLIVHVFEVLRKKIVHAGIAA